MEQVEFKFERPQNAFKIDLSFGPILQNINTQIYRYFASHYTDGLFLFPQLISSRQDIENLRLQLAKLDLSTYFHKQKPNSEWTPVVITNVLYVVYKTSFPKGLSQPLPTKSEILKASFSSRKIQVQINYIQSTLDISKLCGLIFTSSNYLKCKLICTSGNLDL